MSINQCILLVLFFIVASVPLRAQICTGSLGDPIVNITFGAGPNPGQRLSSTATGYQYQTNDCPHDGIYSIRNSSVSCHNNTWHTITDHTGDPNGYFMLVNASMFPGAFYVDTVRGLCGNTTYEFAAWVINILKPGACGSSGIQPNLTFRIEQLDGTLLQSYNSNNIPETASPQWKQFGFFFKTAPATTEVVIRIINNATGGCGNDLALDDITFRPCGPQISSAIIGTSQRSVAICEGSIQTYTFHANVSMGFNNPVVQWQQRHNNGPWNDITGANTNTYSKNFTASDAAGTYNFRLAAAEQGNMSTAQCRIASALLTVEVVSNPKPTIQVTQPVCAGDILNVTSNPAGSWTGPNGFAGIGNIAISNVQPVHAGKYFLATQRIGCSRLDSIEILVHQKPSLSIGSRSFFLCSGDNAIVSISGAEQYSWTPIDNVNAFGAGFRLTPETSTVYKVVGTNIGGCSDSADITITIAALPEAFAGADKVIMEGSTIQLNGNAKGDSVFYEWRPHYQLMGLHSLQPIVSPSQNTDYILRVTSQLGCGSDEDTITIRVLKKLNVPNAFSPNGDAINDTWKIDGIESYPRSEVTVFNRFGQAVYRSTSFREWDGKQNRKPLPIGTYYYIINVYNGLPALSGWLYLAY